MSKKMNPLVFMMGSIAGAAVGLVAGVLLAPRSGAENRAMAADVMSDAWDSAMDAYEQGQQAVVDTYEQIRPTVDAKADELRAKVDLARERMDQLRSSITGSVTPASIIIEDAEVTTEVEDAIHAEASDDGIEPAESAQNLDELAENQAATDGLEPEVETD